MSATQLNSPRTRPFLPRHEVKFTTFAITFRNFTTSIHSDDKFRLVGKLGSQKLISTEFGVEQQPFSLKQAFYFPWQSERDFKLVLYNSKSEEIVATHGLHLPTPSVEVNTLSSDLALKTKSGDSVATVSVWCEFLEHAFPLAARRLKHDGGVTASPVHAPSPISSLSPQHVFDANYPFKSVRVYCYLGAGWKSLRDKRVQVAVGLGGVGLKCTESFPVTRTGDVKISRIFQFPFHKERRIKILLLNPDEGDRVVAEGGFDTLDLVNGNVVTCKQQLTMSDPFAFKTLGYLEVLTEFCAPMLEKVVRRMEEGESPGSPDSRSPDSKKGARRDFDKAPDPPLVPYSVSPLAALMGVVDLQSDTGNATEVLKYSPISDFKTMLIQALAVTELSQPDDVCTVQMRLGFYRSATGSYHRVKQDLRAGIFELHRIPYSKQRYAQVILRIANPLGKRREATAWLDLAKLPAPSKVRVLVSVTESGTPQSTDTSNGTTSPHDTSHRTPRQHNKSKSLGKIHLAIEFIPDVLQSSAPLKMTAADVMSNRPMSLMARQHERSIAVAGIRESRSRSPMLRPLVMPSLCTSSPLMSPRSRDPSSRPDALLESYLATLDEASSQPHPVMDCETVLLQLLGFRNLPDLDGLRRLCLQLVIRVGSRANFTTTVMEVSDTNPDYQSMVLRLPMLELRFITVDIFERTMTNKPFYLGRVVIDTAVVRPGHVVASYEQLVGPNAQFCLYALENETVPGNPQKTSQPVFLKALKKEDAPLYKFMKATEDDVSTVDGSADKSDTYAESTVCIQLGALSGLTSPFPFAKMNVTVQVDYEGIKVASRPVPMEASKSVIINQVIKIPKTTSKFGTLHVSLLASCPVTRPEEVASRTIDIRDLVKHGNGPIQKEVTLGDERSHLRIVIYTSDESRRTGTCEDLRFKYDLFPSLVSAN